MEGLAWFENAPIPGLLIQGVHMKWNPASKSLRSQVQVELDESGAKVLRDDKVLMGYPVQGGLVFWLNHETEEWARLKEQDAFKSQFLNMAAHELNTPLTPIRLQHHLLQSGALGKLSDKQHKAHAILDRNLKRLGTLISDILDVARLEGNGMKLKMEPFDLAEAAQASLDSFQEPSRRVGVALAAEVPERAVVTGNLDRISQVLDNLLANAIKFTPAGGRVTLRISGDEEAKVEVIDSGMGMTKEQQERLFKPFSQVHEKTMGGTGLGLYICKGILASHDQEIQCFSKGAGKGTTFSFALPLAHEAPLSQPKKKNALADRLRELI